MKSIIAAVNLSGLWECAGITFPVGKPVVIYRNQKLFGKGANVGALLGRVAENKLLVVAYAGEQLTAQQVQETANYLLQQVHQCAAASSFSDGYHWRKACADDMLDGMLRELNAFDWSKPDILPRHGVLSVAAPCLTLLACGFLQDARNELSAVIPGTDADFLSAARLEQFLQLFDSALQ